jgi:hypothetical protein
MFEADMWTRKKAIGFYMNVINLLMWPQNAAALVLPLIIAILITIVKGVIFAVMPTEEIPVVYNIFDHPDGFYTAADKTDALTSIFYLLIVEVIMYLYLVWMDRPTKIKYIQTNIKENTSIRIITTIVIFATFFFDFSSNTFKFAVTTLVLFLLPIVLFVYIAIQFKKALISANNDPPHPEW